MILAVLLSYSSVSFSKVSCNSIFSAEEKKSIDSILISDALFDQSTHQLKSTLSGKLATVWRSEWKTKLKVIDSNLYVLDLVNQFLSTPTQNKILAGLDVSTDQFTRKIHERLSKLQESGELNEKDDLAVRDKPTPVGAHDTTFTYYTKPIKTSSGEGKHQLRIRTYVRHIEFAKIPVGNSISGFASNGREVKILRKANHLFELTDSDGVTNSYKTKQLQELYGPKMLLFAPHGKSFKLEVKTALKDRISTEAFPLLGGQHMVQKLDVSLTPQQVTDLFAPLGIVNHKAKVSVSLQRIDKLIADLVQKNPDNISRINAIFDVIKQAVLRDADFLEIEGATVYHRTAFESKSGFQTTIDREQGVYASNIYNNGLNNPFIVISQNKLIKTQEKDARHVELKVPVTSMNNVTGIRFHDLKSAPTSSAVTNNDQQMKKAAGVYYKYVHSSDHSGKFNYILKNGED